MRSKIPYLLPLILLVFNFNIFTVVQSMLFIIFYNLRFYGKVIKLRDFIIYDCLIYVVQVITLALLKQYHLNLLLISLHFIIKFTMYLLFYIDDRDYMYEISEEEVEE